MASFVRLADHRPSREFGRSTERSTSTGRHRRLPGRADLPSQAEHDLGHPAWGSLFRAWLAQGGTACAFAGNRARAADGGLRTSAWTGAVDDPSLADRLQDTLVTTRPQAHVLLFPAARTADDVGALAASLVATPHWFGRVRPDHDDHVLVSLRWPVMGSPHIAEALGFADLPTMPMTRRAPVTAIVVRTIPPAAMGPAEAGPMVHLAQMPYLEQELDRVDQLWQATLSAKADLLSGDLAEAAEATVTFRLATSAWPLAPG